MVGIPGGKESPLVKELVDASRASGDKLDFAAGKGDDPDALATAFVMDSQQYPFFQAEVYHQVPTEQHLLSSSPLFCPRRDRLRHPHPHPHPCSQFHDGFKFDENYPNNYNELAGKLLKQGAVVDQGCPNGLLGIGIAGL